METNPLRISVKRAAFLWPSFFLLFFSFQLIGQDSDDLILVHKTDSFNLFFLQPTDTKTKGVKIKYDATFIENLPDCEPEMVLRATFLFKSPKETIQSARMCVNESVCSNTSKVLNFSVSGGEYRYRLEFKFPRQLPVALFKSGFNQFEFDLDDSRFLVKSNIKESDKMLLRSVLSNNSHCDLLERFNTD